MIDALKSLPSDLQKAYSRVMERMDQGQRDFAFQIMSWIFHTPRPLVMKELQVALVIEDEKEESDEVATSSPDYIVETCAGLVVYDEDTEIVRFNHQTVPEFLRDYCATYLLPPDVLANTCLTYLLLDVFDEFRQQDREHVKERVQKYKLSRYAAQYWGLHTRGKAENKPDIQRKVLSLLASENKKSSMLQMEVYANSSCIYIDFTKGQTLLHVIAKNGLTSICRYILDERNKGELQTLRLSETDTDVAARDGDGSTPLSLAAGNGHLEMVKFLVEEASADVESKDSELGLTPLGHAAAYGRSEVVKWLLYEAKAEVDPKDLRDGWTPLSYAAVLGHSEAVKLLVLEAQAEVESKDKDGRTTLSLAAMKGHLEVVKFLVEEAGAEVESKDLRDGRTPLSWAAENGHSEVVKFLVSEAGADVESKDWLQMTPLSCAARNGHVDTVKFLVKEAGADVESKDDRWGRTPLSWAAFNGRLEVAKFLVKEAGADVEWKDSDGKTVLDLARQGLWDHWLGNPEGGRAVVAWLEAFMEEKKGGGEIKRYNGQLLLAAKIGNVEDMRRLLGVGADVELKDEWGMTPLSWAAYYGYVEAVKFLVEEAGADVELKTYSKRTPLSWAALGGHLEAVKFLVNEAGADVESKDRDGKSALDLATEWTAESWPFDQEGRRAVAAWLEAWLEKKGGGEAGD